ncbi:MAG: TIR domain-containing protein [Proteobacteria bacterium]|nr:TIR domain-containing protein [Pseudomonadota bacterium]
MSTPNPEPVPSTPTGAVFLSYASEDAGVAERICAALRAAGIEVWFDRSELRGGDAWDAMIRRQIKNCALFVPILSRTTHDRVEGYFRLEWKLAIDRSHLIAEDRPFLLPVAVDDIAQSDPRIPERFRELQWTRLAGGQTPPAFVERVQRLLGGTAGSPPAPVAARGAVVESAVARPKSVLHTLIWALTIVSVVAVIGYYTFSRPGTRPGAAPTAAASDAVPEKSIAVLPFVDLSEKHDQGYFSDGLAEELLDLLAQVPDLRVPARTSSFSFKGRSDDIATIAQKLKVAHVLEGSVRRSGDRVRVTAQLIRADNGYHLWSKTYDRDARDIFQVQDEIAGAVVGALKAQLLPAQSLASRHRSDNIEAFNEYLRGNQLRSVDSVESNAAALLAFKHAVELDPHYAAAWSALADAEWRIADQSSAEPAAYQRAAAAAERGIQLAPDSPDGYWARGNLRMAHEFDWAGAEADLARAYQLDNDDVRVLGDYGVLLAARGQMPRALALLRRAVALDPLSARAMRVLVQHLLDAGHIEEAENALAAVPESTRAANLMGLQGEIELARGNYPKALDTFSHASTLWGTIGIAMAAHSVGHTEQAQEALDSLIGEHASTLAYQIAEVYAWWGDRPHTYEWLERAYMQRDGGLIYLNHDRYFVHLRGEPAFQAFLKKLNLGS